MRVLSLALALVLAACSDETLSREKALEVAAGIPIGLAELPGGWGPATAEVAAELELSPGCDIFDPQVVFPGALGRASSPALEGPLDEQLQTFGAVYAEEDAAEADIAATVDILERCEEEFRDAVRGFAEGELEALGIDLGFFADIDVEIEELERPAIGDSARAYRLGVHVSLPGDDQRFTLDAIAVREGRVAGGLVYGVFGGIDETSESEITSALREKLTAAEGELP
jgi:hypothetical protein